MGTRIMRRRRRRNPFSINNTGEVINLTLAVGAVFLVYRLVQGTDNWYQNLMYNLQGPAPGQSWTDYLFGGLFGSSDSSNQSSQSGS